MSGENYDEGIERIHLSGASQDTHQQYLRQRQRKRLKERLFGLIAALLIVGIGYGSIWYHSRNQDTALQLLAKISFYLEQEKYNQALQTAEAIIDTDSFEWHGYFYKTVSLIYLNRPKEAKQLSEATYQTYSKPYLPLHFHPVLIFTLEDELGYEKIKTHFMKLENTFGKSEIISRYLSEGKICYPKQAILEPDFGKATVPDLVCFSEQVVEAYRTSRKQ